MQSPAPSLVPCHMLAGVPACTESLVDSPTAPTPAQQCSKTTRADQPPSPAATPRAARPALRLVSPLRQRLVRPSRPMLPAGSAVPPPALPRQAAPAAASHPLPPPPPPPFFSQPAAAPTKPAPAAPASLLHEIASFQRRQLRGSTEQRAPHALCPPRPAPGVSLAEALKNRFKNVGAMDEDEGSSWDVESP